MWMWIHSHLVGLKKKGGMGWTGGLRGCEMGDNSVLWTGTDSGVGFISFLHALLVFC